MKIKNKLNKRLFSFALCLVIGAFSTVTVFADGIGKKQGKSSFVCKQPIWIFLVFGTAQCLRTLYHTGGIF